MDLTGSARSLGNALVKLIGPASRWQQWLSCLADDLWRHLPVRRGVRHLSHGLFHLPGRRPARTLLPGPLPPPAFGITMTAVPGTPDSEPDPHRLLRHHHHGGSAPVPCGLRRYAAARLYLSGWRVRQSAARACTLSPTPKHKEVDPRLQGSALLALGHRHRPLVVVVLMLNLFPWLLNRFAGIELASNYAIVIALVCGILVACLLNLNQARTLLPAINEEPTAPWSHHEHRLRRGLRLRGRSGPRLASLTSIALNMPGSILFSEAVAVDLLAGATGSTSGGMSIALSALGPSTPKWAAGNTGVLEALHRIASHLPSGGLDHPAPTTAR